MRLTATVNCQLSKWLCQCLVLLVWLASTNAHAEYLGLINGRTANTMQSTDLAAELGLVTGDLDRFDYQNIAARVSYRLNDETTLIGNIGTSEFGESDGTPYGLGLIYQLSRQRMSDKLHLAGKLSYHEGGYEFRNANADLASLAIELLFSGKQPLADNLDWYTNVGYHRISVELASSDSTNELGIGAGLVMSTGLGEAYVGFDHIQEFVIGIGFRYFVQRP
ncbi:MAG: hypothetical protein KTR32_03545 [Granulosicoccus sp.]|nr:hypothetical protein [Granulosicoccus sp.]